MISQRIIVCAYTINTASVVNLAHQMSSMARMISKIRLAVMCLCLLVALPICVASLIASPRMRQKNDIVGVVIAVKPFTAGGYIWVSTNDLKCATKVSDPLQQQCHMTLVNKSLAFEVNRAKSLCQAQINDKTATCNFGLFGMSDARNIEIDRAAFSDAELAHLKQTNWLLNIDEDTWLMLGQIASFAILVAGITWLWHKMALRRVHSVVQAFVIVGIFGCLVWGMWIFTLVWMLTLWLAD